MRACVQRLECGRSPAAIKRAERGDIRESGGIPRMVKFLLRRFLRGIVVVVGVSILMFLLARVIPGDPARLALGPAATADQVTALRQEMGFDKPIVEQYLNF